VIGSGARQNNESVQTCSWMDMWSARPANATLPVRSFRGLMQAAVQRIAGVGRPYDTARCARLRGWLLWRARTIGVSTGKKSFSQQARVHQGRHRKGTFCVSIIASHARVDRLARCVDMCGRQLQLPESSSRRPPATKTLHLHSQLVIALHPSVVHYVQSPWLAAGLPPAASLRSQAELAPSNAVHA
jgi:hypothetical protein